MGTTEKSIIDFSRAAMFTYGSEVNEDRAVPSFQDGLKPVGRRVLWSMYHMSRGQVKTARVSGDVIGKYHPHAPTGPEGMMCTFVNSPFPPILGIGNWGSMIDPPAASRYTEVKLTNYGETFLAKNYMAVVPLVPNYDYKDKEPIYLPALLPHILLNDSTGIGVGMATSIPSFTPDSLLKVLIRLIDKEELKAADYAKCLVFHDCYGGTVVKTRENRKALVDFFSTTSGSIEFESPIQVNREAKKVLLNRFAPSLNLDTLLQKLRTLPEVDKVYSGKGLSYIIQIKRNVNFNDFDKFLVKLQRLTTTRQKFSIYVTERQPNPENPEKYDVKFHNLSVPQLLLKWLKFRIQLERDSLAYQITQQEAAIAYTKLLIYACDHLDAIFKVLRQGAATQSELEEKLAKAIKVTKEQAKQILDLKVRQLSKLDQDALKAKLAEQQSWLKSLLTKIKRPAQEVKKFFELCLSQLVCHQERKIGMDQWWLKKGVV